jgi:Domain of unknown function (DUF4956)
MLLKKIYEDGKLFNMDLVSVPDLIELVVKFSLNFIIVLLIVRFIYYSVAKRKDYLFTYLMISVTVFLLCFLLENVKLQLGFALGLFAIFGIIRYRTNPIPIREMTYLFIVIGISVINALANKKISYSELLFTNFIIVLIIWLFEKVFFLKHLSEKDITYEKIDLIKPERQEELKADLEKRTGLNIHKIEVGKINFLRDSARVKIYYYEKGNTINQADTMDDYKNYNNNDDE